jgi:hypothetical protein
MTKSFSFSRRSTPDVTKQREKNGMIPFKQPSREITFMKMQNTLSVESTAEVHEGRQNKLIGCEKHPHYLATIASIPLLVT